MKQSSALAVEPVAGAVAIAGCCGAGSSAHSCDAAPAAPSGAQIALKPRARRRRSRWHAMARLVRRSPSELYCLGVGVLFVGAGIAGFFYHGSRSREAVFGLVSTDPWHNLLHLGLGLAALRLLARAPRVYAGALGAANSAIAAWGFALGSGSAPILGFMTVNATNDIQRLTIGVLGLAAAAANRPFARVDRRATSGGVRFRVEVDARQS
jgi:hypothetical protein